MRSHAVIFDLDGTLLDSLADLAAATNEALAALGYPTHPAAAYRRMIGGGIELLARRALPGAVRDERAVAACVTRVREAYDRRWAETTRPFSGIPELLTRLSELGIPMAVLSNKPHDFTTLAVSRLLAPWHFATVLGAKSDLATKPDPAGALRITHELGLVPGVVAFLGDSDVDMQAARGAGMLAVGALWGFRDADELAQAGAQALIAQPHDLLPLLAGASGLSA